MIDALRNLGVGKDLLISQVAVMRDQSSGKISVLESLSSIPFPRGSGLLTRCATQGRMAARKLTLIDLPGIKRTAAKGRSEDFSTAT